MKVVGMTGFEPATSASRTQRSTKLSHIPRDDDCTTGLLDSGMKRRQSTFFVQRSQRS
jgi:hypothetical protein